MPRDLRNSGPKNAPGMLNLRRVGHPNQGSSTHVPGKEYLVSAGTVYEMRGGLVLVRTKEIGAEISMGKKKK
jgi:hypothetical protein